MIKKALCIGFRFPMRNGGSLLPTLPVLMVLVSAPLVGKPPELRGEAPRFEGGKPLLTRFKFEKIPKIFQWIINESSKPSITKSKYYPLLIAIRLGANNRSRR
jgi:hypothetical protein